MACYDAKYALRLCTKYDRKRACVLIYSAMNAYEQAVDLAMQVDIDLAQQIASKPEDEGLKKMLWLNTARYVIEHHENGIKAYQYVPFCIDLFSALEFLQRCEFLKIEDIMPFFPEFDYIDDFKVSSFQ